MFRNRIAVMAASAVSGVLLLTACQGIGSGATSSPDKVVANSVADAALASMNFLRGTAKENNAPANTGDFANHPGKPTTPAGKKWVQLSASSAGNLDPVVVDGAGFTLYRFDKDPTDPTKSNCNGDCAVTWPPVIVNPEGRIFIDGVDKSAVGLLKRADGSLQVTIEDRPVYRFSKDLKPGDTNGQGIGRTWFGVTPDGQKAGLADGGENVEVSDAATNAVLFDDANFADNGSQGLSGKGCQNVARDDIASSIQATGSLKLWSEADCKGTSKVITGKVADLNTIGLDNDISSVFFG